VIREAAALDAVVVNDIAESKFIHTRCPGLCSITGVRTTGRALSYRKTERKVLIRGQSTRVTCDPLMVKHGADIEKRSGVNGWTLRDCGSRAQNGVCADIADGGRGSGHGFGHGGGLRVTAGIAGELLGLGSNPARTSGVKNALDAALSGTADTDR
jgi:hypothetical protein